MFKFDDLDAMGRAVMLLKQQEAKRHWQAVYKLEQLWSAFGKDAINLLDQHTYFAQSEELKADMRYVADLAGLKTRKIAKYLEKLDVYMHDMDTRLSDGSKWYNAQDIQKMADSISPED